MAISYSRVRSLWEMLEEVDPQYVVKSVSLLASEAARFDMLCHVANQRQVSQIPADPNNLDFAMWACDLIKQTADNMQMVGVARATERLKGWLEIAQQKPSEIPVAFADQIGRGMAQLVAAFGDEVDGRKLFIMTPKFAALYESQEPLFGAKVEAAFPTSSPEIQEAGKCMALGRWTAAVMHLMRALEPGLKALQTAVKVDVPKEQWGQILDQIESKIKQVKRSTHGKADEQWYAEAATSFSFLKNAWRNYANHLHERYDEERAEAIYHHVRAFMRHLSTRLSEPTA